MTVGAVYSQSDGEPKKASYVALGDSYSAGNGTTGASGDCRRSPHAYGPLLAKQLHWGDRFAHMACSSADTTRMRKTQLESISKKTRLVTMTIGGNDGNAFVAILGACAINPMKAVCDRVAESVGKYVSTSLPRRLDETYADVSGRLGREATVLVGGYPVAYDKQCGPLSLSPSKHKRVLMNEFSVKLNEQIADAVSRAGRRFEQHWAFMPADFSGHGLCSKHPWLHGPEELALDPAGAWHPTDEGHEHYKDGFGKLYRSITQR